jgi:carboxylate-amine ligase
MRTVGVEEELLVVDGETGRPLSVADRVLRRADASEAGEEHGYDDQPGGSIGAELQRQQVETDTPPRTDMTELEGDLQAWRDVAVRAARESGARIVASGTAPTEVSPQPHRDERYQRIMEKYGSTSAEQLTCGCHVHVAVESDEEAVAVLDRLRPWFPSLLAITGNSPFWQGRDTHYASFRSQVIARWPSSGTPDVFGSPEAYRERVEAMVATGVLLDANMVYWDARPSSEYPTLEVRIADVCLDVRDAVLLAALSRGLVDTAAAEWRDGRPPADVSSSMLRLASWQAARCGVDGDLLDPHTLAPRPAAAVLGDLLEHVRPALEANGDATLVEERLKHVLQEGNGARRQREVLARTGSMVDVVADLARVTAGLDG